MEVCCIDKNKITLRLVATAHTLYKEYKSDSSENARINFTERHIHDIHKTLKYS